MFDSTAFILILGLAFTILFVLYVLKLLGRGRSPKLLFKDFRRKMWMTMSLGGVFFSLYLALVTLSVPFIRNSGTAIFFLLYQHPVEFVYGGLFFFAFLSLSIYLVRMVIKYFYLTKGKDS
jgi:hypothetical protein